MDKVIYEVDPLVCSNCGGQMKIVAFITDRKVIRAILASMRKGATPAFPSGLAPPAPSRSPGRERRGISAKAWIESLGK